MTVCKQKAVLMLNWIVGNLVKPFKCMPKKKKIGTQVCFKMLSSKYKKTVLVWNKTTDDS